MTHFEKPQDPWDAVVINTPQPIRVKKEDYYIIVEKQDVPIVKVNSEDKEALNVAITLLNGLLRCGAVYGEIENVRDILKAIKNETLRT